MSTTFKEVLDEVFARGFDDLRDGGTQEARAKRWVNVAYREVIDFAPWPFRETTAEGTAPLEIKDLGHVQAVAAGDTQIPFVSRATIAQSDPGFDDTGTAQSWFRQGESTVAVYPLDTKSTIKVRYLRTPATLSANGDLLVIPDGYTDVVVDGAVVRAYKNRDNFEAAQGVRQEWERGLRQMVNALLRPNYDNAPSVMRTGWPSDYLY